MKVRIFTDGGARGNPGPAGAGAVIKSEDGSETLAELSRYLGETTNNQAEYIAIIMALEKALEMGADEADVYMDTQLAERQLNGAYKVKHPGIKERFAEVQALRGKFSSIRFTHVRREQNKEADALVNQCIDAQLG